MPQRAQAEDGFGLIELLAAMAVLSIALLALVAGYGSAVVIIRKSSVQTSAAAIAASQLELYRALPYNSIGLDTTMQANAIANDSTYASDESNLGSPVDLSPPVDVTIANCTASVPAAACTPIQTVTGADGHSYRVETFIRDMQDQNSLGITWSERNVTVIVRDPTQSGMPFILQSTTAFDRG